MEANSDVARGGISGGAGSGGGSSSCRSPVRSMRKIVDEVEKEEQIIFG